MPLTPAQVAALATDIAANTATAPGTQGAIKDLPHTPDNAFAVALWYNLTVGSAYWVIRTDAPVTDILNNVTWANYTPNVTVTSTNATQAQANSNYAQGKMLNVQTMTIGRDSFNATLPNQTAGLKDATTALPCGANFANQTGGWNNIVGVLQRQPTNVEKLFAVANTAVPTLQNGASARGTKYDGTNGNPDLMAFEGTLSDSDVRACWGI